MRADGPTETLGFGGDELDLVVDLNTMDDTGLPWAFLEDARRPERVVPGEYVVVGSGAVRAAASVVDVVDGIVHVRPLSGPVAKHRHLLHRVS
jgi:hypothetical protein